MLRQQGGFFLCWRAQGESGFHRRAGNGYEAGGKRRLSPRRVYFNTVGKLNFDTWPNWQELIMSLNEGLLPPKLLLPQSDPWPSWDKDGNKGRKKGSPEAGLFKLVLLSTVSPLSQPRMLAATSWMSSLSLPKEQCLYHAHQQKKALWLLLF